MKRLPLLTALLLALALLGYLAHHALINPETAFLRPSLTGTWIVHPAIPMNFQTYPFCPDVRFSLTFTPITPSADIQITAPRHHTVTLNNHPLTGPPQNSWKHSTPYHLTLTPNQPNTLQIFVSNPEGPPALLVESSNPQLRSDPRWYVATAPDYTSPGPAVIPFQTDANTLSSYNPLLTDPKNQPTPNAKKYTYAFLAYCTLIAYALIPANWKPWRKKNPPALAAHPATTPNFWLLASGFLIPALCFLAVASVQLHNAYAFTFPGGSDWAGHEDHIRYVAKNWSTPDATQGWEMFQPPLFYNLAAVLYHLSGGTGDPARTPAEIHAFRSAQFLSTVSGLLNLLLTFYLLHRLLPKNSRARNLGFATIAIAPVAFCMNPTITNEVFAGFIIALTTVTSITRLFPHIAAGLPAVPRLTRPTWPDALLLGTLCGLSLLSKFTGLFILLALTLLLLFRALARIPRANRLLLILPTALALSSWFYTRNYFRFGDPFIGNWSKASTFHYVQGPGYRNLAFYSSFGQVFNHTPIWSMGNSFWDGMYSTFWTDAHSYGNLTNYALPQTQTTESLALALALLPTIAIFLGFLLALRHLLTKNWNHPYFILVLTAVFTFVSLFTFTMDVPTYSTIKSWFILSLFPPLALFAALGLNTMAHNLGKLRFLLYLNLAALYYLNLPLFWYALPK